MQAEIMAGRAGLVAAEAARAKARRLYAQCGMWVALAVCATPLAALRTAAGGTSGQNGFQDVSAFLDRLATFLIYLAIPAGALGLIAAGGMLIGGNPNGTTWLARTAIGVGIVLLAKGIMA